MSANEKAEAILIVIKKIFKWFAIAIATLITIGLLLYAFSEMYDWYSEGRHKSKVQVVAFFDDKNCTKSHPLFIGVVNNSSKTIEYTSTRIKVTKKGFSSQLNYDTSFSYDKIIPPTEGWGMCWSVFDDNFDSYKRKPLDGKDMDVAVTSFYPRFTNKN